MKEIYKKYTPVIGLEIHAQLSTQSKIYAGDSTAFGQDPNTNVSVVTLAHPGTLPLINKKVIEYAVKMGLACNCEITEHNIFCRKNYFYPDLPKGYQLTQDKTPICVGGEIKILTKNGQERGIKLNRIHLEEDAGKSVHLQGEKDTLVDLNRAGVALIEIVTEPDISSADEAAKVMTEIRKLVRFLDVCDGNMEEGSLRCDANVSIMPVGSKELGVKVELKNMNSIKQIKNAIEHEIKRQIEVVESGEKVVSQTRTYDPATGKSIGMRIKEELNDYRYFPEPDLSPVVVTEAWLEKLRMEMPVLPVAWRRKFLEQYSLPEYDAGVLTESRAIAEFFDALCQETSNYKAASNWVMGPVKSYLKDEGLKIEDANIDVRRLAGIIRLIDEGKISFTSAAQQLFPASIQDQQDSVEQIAEKLNLIQERKEETLLPIIDEVITKFPDKVKAYKKGKKGLIGMFMGEVMKVSKGKADPKKANVLLKERLESIEI